MVSKVPQLNMIKTADDSCPMLRIPDSSQPLIENICCFDFVFHRKTVALKRQGVNC